MASIFKLKKTGKWCARVSYKDKHGNYRTKTKKTFTTKKEAEVYAADLEKKLHLGEDIINEEIIFSEYFEDWFKTYKFGKVSPSTEAKYFAEINRVKDYFGTKKIKDITRQDYQKYLNKRGKNRGKDVVEKTHFYLKACFQLALADGVISKDPTFKAIISYDNEYNTRIKYWSVQEYERLAKRLYTTDAKDIMLYIALMTGLRIGEVYGLAWEDITPTTISVNRGFDYQHLHYFTKGKNTSSIRTISIPPELYSLVQMYKLQKIKVYPRYLFYTKMDREVISHRGLLTYLKKVCHELEIKELSIHCLRHTHCSYLIYKGLDINYISKRLGHSSTIETLRTYSHIVDEFNQQQNDKIIDILSNISSK